MEPLPAMLGDITRLTDRLRRSPDHPGAGALADTIDALRAALADTMARTTTATDPTGEVHATVRTDGHVDSVYVSPRAVRDMTAGQIGAAAVAAVQAARAALADEFRAVFPEPDAAP